MLAVESVLTLPQDVKFPFQYKYYVPINSKAKECYEYLSHPYGSGYVNRCIQSKDGLVPGMQGMYKEVMLSTQ